MKISKNSHNTVSSSTNPDDELNAMVYEDAKKYINQAIKSLGAYARRTKDEKAKEAIANLSVILLDLNA